VDTPLKAMLEALAYCATLDREMRDLSHESDDKKGTLLHVVCPTRPNLLVLAPAEYWDLCDLAGSCRSWREPLQAVCRRIELALKIRVHFCSHEQLPVGDDQTRDSTSDRISCFRLGHPK
jgi:hypothetical protein